ncbi:DUF397 domain-containing protein [Streptomyces anulatus]
MADRGDRQRTYLSKVTDGPAFAVAPAAWTAFLGHATATTITVSG